jgi:hypothetical protein
MTAHRIRWVWKLFVVVELLLLPTGPQVVRVRSASAASGSLSSHANHVLVSAKSGTSSGRAEPTPIPGWYDTSWSNRKAIIIVGSAAGTQANYHVRVTLAYEPSMRGDFGDIRFTSLDGTTPLDHYLEIKTDSLLSVFWARVPSIPPFPGTTAIYAYYGNSSAISTSSGLDTFTRFDDFASVAAQWRPYQDNPILVPESDEEMTAWGSVWIDQGMYHAFYSYRNASGRLQIGHATSPDGKGWTKDSAHNPILTVTDGWEDTDLWDPSVWREGSTWYMLYAGNVSINAVGLATASNPEGPWTREATNPVLTGTGGQWDEGSTENMHAIKVGDVYYLWYNTLADRGLSRQVGLATSTDLKNWTKDPHNPIFSSLAGGGYFQPAPFKYGDYYYLLLMHYTVDGSGYHYPEIQLYRDRSPTFYPKERRFLKVAKACSASGWDSTNQDTPSVVTDDIYRNSFPSSQLWTYYAGQAADGPWETGLLIEDLPGALTPGESNMHRWTVRTSPEVTVSLDGNMKKSGGYSYRIDDVSATTAGSIESYSDALASDISETSGTMEAWMRTSHSTGAGNDGFDMDLYQDANLQAAVGFDSATQKFHYWDGVARLTSTSYSFDTWYLLGIEFNAPGNRYNFVVRDSTMKEILRVNNVSFASAPTVINKVVFKTTDGYRGIGHVDAFRLRESAYPEPISFGYRSNLPVVVLETR